MFLARYRGLLAGSCAGVAVLAALPVLAPGPEPTVPVLVAARDLRWGVPLSGDDVTVAARPAAAVPDGALTKASAVQGRLLTAPVRRGEAITDVRVLGPAAVEPGLRAVGVRIADAGMATVLRAGAVIDVLAAAVDTGFDSPGGLGVGIGAAEVVAGGVRVLAVPTARRAGLDGVLVLVAATEAQAARLAAASATRHLSVALRTDNVGRP